MRASLAALALVLALTLVLCNGCGGTLQAVNGPIQALPPNRAPAIESAPVAARSQVYVGESVVVSVEATDPDGDPLTYHWSAPAGTFTAGADASEATWQAPPTVRGTGQRYRLTVAVRDTRGGEVFASVEVLVLPAP